MFTGLIEGIGTVSDLEAEGPGVRVRITLPKAMCDGELAIGDSVAINGCCLTVVTLADSQVEFQAGSETLSRTNLGSLEVGSCVNLERSLRARDRLGGHFVQGHVDAIGQVSRVEIEGEWTRMWFDVPAAIARLMVEKGSVAIDGVSLTVVDADRDSFSIALIPHTLSVTTLGQRASGDAVNIETDIIGKYVDRLAAFSAEEE